MLRQLLFVFAMVILSHICHAHLKLVHHTDLNAAILHQSAKPVRFPLNVAVKRLIKDMKHYVTHNIFDEEGFTVGLAAPQVGALYRITVIQIPQQLAKREGVDALSATILINPSYEALSSDFMDMEEGCLSAPGMYGQVRRFPHIRYHYYDLEGNAVTKEAKGLEAHIVQHEVDHLNGILFADRANIYLSSQDYISAYLILKPWLKFLRA